MESQIKRIRVLIADDHPVIRERLGKFLSGQRDIDLVGLATNGKEAYDLAQELHLDVLVLDIEMPEMDGPEVATRLIGTGCKTSILFFSAYFDKTFAQDILIEGVKGFFSKDEGPFKLLQAIRLASLVPFDNSEGRDGE